MLDDMKEFINHITGLDNDSINRVLKYCYHQYTLDDFGKVV